MKVIFLDIDGVFNSRSRHLECVHDDEVLTCEHYMTLLNEIFERVDNLYVVVSSSWHIRYSLEEVQLIFESFGFKYQLGEWLIQYYRTGYNTMENRCYSASRWLDECPYDNIEASITLDDGISKGLAQEYGLRAVQTRHKTGITKEKVDEVVYALNG